MVGRLSAKIEVVAIVAVLGLSSGCLGGERKLAERRGDSVHGPSSPVSNFLRCTFWGRATDFCDYDQLHHITSRQNRRKTANMRYVKYDDHPKR